MLISANSRLGGKIEGEAPNVIKTFEGTIGVIFHQEGSQNLGNNQLVVEKLFKVSILQNFVSALFELRLKGKKKENGRWTIQLHHHQCSIYMTWQCEIGCGILARDDRGWKLNNFTERYSLGVSDNYSLFSFSSCWLFIIYDRLTP